MVRHLNGQSLLELTNLLGQSDHVAGPGRTLSRKAGVKTPTALVGRREISKRVCRLDRNRRQVGVSKDVCWRGVGACQSREQEQFLDSSAYPRSTALSASRRASPPERPGATMSSHTSVTAPSGPVAYSLMDRYRIRHPLRALLGLPSENREGRRVVRPKRFEVLLRPNDEADERERHDRSGLSTVE